LQNTRELVNFARMCQHVVCELESGPRLPAFDSYFSTLFLLLFNFRRRFDLGCFRRNAQLRCRLAAAYKIHEVVALLRALQLVSYPVFRIYLSSYLLSIYVPPPAELGSECGQLPGLVLLDVEQLL
jgi:hypothetical protein